MATGEALAALLHHGLVSCAHQVSTGLPIREAAVEEVWAWPPHYQFDCVGEDAIQGQGQAGRCKAKKLTVSGSAEVPVSFSTATGDSVSWDSRVVGLQSDWSIKGTRALVATAVPQGGLLA